MILEHQICPPCQSQNIHSQGIDIIGVDSDGNVEELIPLWLEVSINLVYPMEVQAGMDVVHTAQKIRT